MRINRLNRQKAHTRMMHLQIFRPLKWIFGILIAFGNAINANAQTWQSLEEISITAKNFLEEMQRPADNQDIEVIVSHVDPRTRLSACEVPIIAFLAPGARARGKTTVGVRCDGNKPWKLFVSARVVEYQEVWVTSRNLAKSDVIGQADLEKKRISIDRLRKTPLLDGSQIVSTSPKRHMRAGEIIFQDSVCLVCRGQTVTVSAANEFLAINVEGIALVDAAMGETAKVRNTRSKRVFDAIVTGKNQLSIKLAQTAQ